MADLSITPANVEAGTTPTPNIGEAIASEAIDAGEVVYLDPTANNQAALADADTSATARAKGVAITSSAAGQPVKYVRSGELILGTGVTTEGVVYVVSTTAGGIAPIGDLGSGDFVTVLGVGTGTDRMVVSIIDSQAEV